MQNFPGFAKNGGTLSNSQICGGGILNPFFNKTFRLILEDKFMNLLSICCPKLLPYVTVNENNNKQDNANGNNSAQTNATRPAQKTTNTVTIETNLSEQKNTVVQNNTCSEGNQINTVVEMTPVGTKKVVIMEEKQINPINKI